MKSKADETRFNLQMRKYMFYAFAILVVVIILAFKLL